MIGIKIRGAGGCKMEDKTEEIVKQYPIHVNGKRRIRGAILFEAKEGIFTLIH